MRELQLLEKAREKQSTRVIRADLVGDLVRKGSGDLQVVGLKTVTVLRL